MQDPNFSFRPLCEADLPMLHRWLQRPHLQRWWGKPPTLAELREKYLPRIDGADRARPFVACLGQKEIGYIQYYLACGGDPAWWPDTPGAGVFGIDQFLADGKMLGRGLGTGMISRFCDGLFRDLGAEEIRVDPVPENDRAIRCYRKVGFCEQGRITTPDGPALWMSLTPGSLARNFRL